MEGCWKSARNLQERWRSEKRGCVIALMTVERRTMAGWSGSRGGGVAVRNYSQFPAISQFPTIFRNVFQFFGNCFWLVQRACLLVPFACSVKRGDVERFFSRCGSIPKRQHKSDDNVRRLRFMLQFHGDIEGRLLSCLRRCRNILSHLCRSVAP